MRSKPVWRPLWATSSDRRPGRDPGLFRQDDEHPGGNRPGGQDHRGQDRPALRADRAHRAPSQRSTTSSTSTWARTSATGSSSATGARSRVRRHRRHQRRDGDRGGRERHGSRGRASGRASRGHRQGLQVRKPQTRRGLRDARPGGSSGSTAAIGAITVRPEELGLGRIHAGRSWPSTCASRSSIRRRSAEPARGALLRVWCATVWRKGRRQRPLRRRRRELSFKGAGFARGGIFDRFSAGAGGEALRLQGRRLHQSSRSSRPRAPRTSAKAASSSSAKTSIPPSPSPSS